MSKQSRDQIIGRNRVVGDAPVDDATGHVIILPFEEHELRQGNLWSFSHLAESIASGNFLYVQINTGPLRAHLHSVRMWSAAPRTRLDLFVGILGSQVTDGTAEITLNQVNQTADVEKPENLKLYSNPSNITVDPDHSEFFGGGGGVGVANSDTDEYRTPLIMAPNSRNIIRLKNDDTLARAISITGLLHVEDR